MAQNPEKRSTVRLNNNIPIRIKDLRIISKLVVVKQGGKG